MAQTAKKGLSGLEHKVMEIIWETGSGTAEKVRLALDGESQLKDSTVRTILRRLEEKGFLTHEVDQRTYVYRPTVAQQSAAVRAVRQIIDRFCGGSVEKLLVGMVDDDVLDERQLKELAERISEDRREGGKDRGPLDRE